MCVLQNHGRSPEEIREHVRLMHFLLSLSLFLICMKMHTKKNYFFNDRSFTLTPQRMRMIVEAFKDTLELGLEKPKQVVVRPSLGPSITIGNHVPGSLLLL